MAVNKVIYGDRTLVDLTQDSVNEDNLLEGETAHDASGNAIEGTLRVLTGSFVGTCTSQAANQIKAVVVSSDQNFTLKKGVVVGVKFDANNTFSATTDNPIKLNVNSSGAKQIYGAGSATPTGTNTTFFGRADYINYYQYDGTYWVWAGSSADNNTTYTPQALGFGYGTCATAAATTAKVATLSGYSLVTNGTVVIKFTYAVPANATLNINSKGAKAIYYRGAAITADIIEAGDVVTFMYNGSQYVVLTIDRSANVDNETVAFTEASTRANIASGESISTLFGKIKKFFTDIKDLAFISKDGSSSKKYLRGDGTWQAFSKSTVGLGNVDNTADNNKPVPIVECSTARSTADKVVALTGFTLKTGSRIYVRFTDTGTSNPASGNLTLNVNSTGAKTIVDGKTNKSVLTYSSAGWFYNNIVSEFVYDGTYWVWMSRDNNTTYSAMSASELTTGTATNLRTVRADYLKTGINNLISGKADKTDIATVESGTTASRAYSVGELVYVSGTLYRVKTDIANGATFTVRTNIEVTNVSGALKDSIKMVYDQYFTLTGTGAVYIDIDKDYPVDGYKLIGLTIASNAIGYVAQARIRNASRITGFVQKSNGGAIATSESVQIGITLIYSKN